MNKYEAVAASRENWEFGFIDLPGAMDVIVTKWCDENGGRMNYDDLVEMVEYVESVEWWSMAYFMQGYFWGASIDDPNELWGEQMAKMELAR